MYVLSIRVKAERRSQRMSCFGSLEGPIHFYSNGIILHSQVFQRGYLRKITFATGGKAEKTQAKGRKMWVENGICLNYY